MSSAGSIDIFSFHPYHSSLILLTYISYVVKGGRGGLIDSETEEVLAEFDFLSTHTSNEHEGGGGRKDPSWRPGLCYIIHTFTSCLL